MVKICIPYLSIGALSQDFKQLELRGVCFLTTLLNMVADVNLLEYTVILRKERQTGKTEKLRKAEEMRGSQ